MKLSTRAKTAATFFLVGALLVWIEPRGIAVIAWVIGHILGTEWGIHKEKVGAAYRESLKSSQQSR